MPDRGGSDACPGRRGRRGAAGHRLACTAHRRPPRRAGARTGAPLFGRRTQDAGAFLLIPPALDWLTVARQCLADDYGTLPRGLLTSVFALVIGLERMWHLDDMED